MDILYQLYLIFLEKIGIQDEIIILSWFILPFFVSLFALAINTIVIFTFEKKILPLLKKEKIASNKKLITTYQEEIREIYTRKPAINKSFLYNFSPICSFTTSLLLIGIIPYSNKYIPLSSETGIILFWSILGIGLTITFLSCFISQDKFSILASMRQNSILFLCILPMIFASIGCATLASNTNLNEIILNQSAPNGISGWYILPAIIGFCVFFAALILFAKTQKEEKNEKYTGMRYLLLRISQYGYLFVLCSLFVCLYCGGYLPLFGFYLSELFQTNYTLNISAVYIEQIIWFLTKTFLIIFIILYLKELIKEKRNEQIAQFVWQRLLPLSLIGTMSAYAIKYFIGGIV